MQLDFLLTILVATFVGIIFYKLKVPGGLMIGAICGVAAFNILTGNADMPYEAKFLAQTISGAFIGVGISKKDLSNFKKLGKPLLILVSGLMILNIIVGFTIYFITDLDLLTCFFIAVPGGMSDTPIIAEEMGADGAIVAALQFVRLCIGIGVFPSIIKEFGKNEDSINKGEMKVDREPYSCKGFILTVIASLLGGVTGEILNIPAGTLVFALIFTIIAKQFYNKCNLPVLARRIAQILAGAYIGSSMTYNDFIAIIGLIIPAIILVLGYLIACVIISRILKRYCNFSIKEGMLCATPAGASDMALISADIGVSNPDVVVLQVARMLCAIIIFPQVLNFIYIVYTGFFGI